MRIIKQGKLEARIRRGKFGRYTYKSPRWGYKIGYRANIIINVYDGSRRIATIQGKEIKIAEIKDYLKKLSNFIARVSGMERVKAYRGAKVYGLDYGYLRALFE